MNAGDGNDQQPRDLEYEGPKVYHSIVLCRPVYSARDSAVMLAGSEDSDDLPHIVIEMPPRGEGADAARAMGEGFLAHLAIPGVDADEDRCTNYTVGMIILAGIVFIVVVATRFLA